jgi:nucleotidyltransferase/DNA polymerase involved in DNA repair
MHLACVFVPRFPLAVEREAIGARPAIIYERNHVLEASPQLTDVWPGRHLRQVRALHPEALFIPADPARYHEAAQAMLRALERVGPEVEPAEQGRAYVGVRGLERMFIGSGERWEMRSGDDVVYVAIGQAMISAVREATGMTPSVAIASSKFVARVASVMCNPGYVRVVAEGAERSFLRDQPSSLLPFDEEITQRLYALALHTLGEIAALPRPAVEAQFWSIGGRMWDLANGIDSDPLRPRRTPESLTERLSFESPVATSEALVMAARQIVKRLCVRLGARASRRMKTRVLSEGRLTWERLDTFREPPDEARMMLALKPRLEALQLGETIDTVEITLSEIGNETGKQAKLLADTNPQFERLLETVHQIRIRFGRPMMWRAVEVDPCSRHPEDRTVLIPYDA